MHRCCVRAIKTIACSSTVFVAAVAGSVTPDTGGNIAGFPGGGKGGSALPRNAPAQGVDQASNASESLPQLPHDLEKRYSIRPFTRARKRK